MSKLTIRDLAQILPQKKHGLVSWQARISHYYCAAVQSRYPDKCSKPCSANAFCVDHLRKISNISADARDPLAVLTWRIRDEIAKLDEETAEELHIPIIANQFGTISTEDPFALLLEQLR